MTTRNTSALARVALSALAPGLLLIAACTSSSGGRDGQDGRPGATGRTGATGQTGDTGATGDSSPSRTIIIDR